MNKERFEYLEKRHDELMKITEENTAIMHEINNSNILIWLWNHVNGNWKSAVQNCEKALQESREILQEFDSEYGSFDDYTWYIYKK